MSSRPVCPGCRTRPVGINKQTGKLFKACKNCTCKTSHCFDRAVHENGLCDAHFKKPVILERNCRLCSLPCKSNYCVTCIKKVPDCQAIGCKRKVIMNSDGIFFHFCSYCKCRTNDCVEQKCHNSEYCAECVENSVCQSCGNRKSTNHSEPNCRTCQLPQCAHPGCTNRTGYYKQNDETFTFTHCKQHVCETKNCGNGQADDNDHFCSECIKNLPNVCLAVNCGKAIGKNEEYCRECNFQFPKKIKCPTIGCKNYKFNRPHVTVCAVCYLPAQEDS